MTDSLPERPDFEALAQQLEQGNVRDRVLAMLAVQQENVPAELALPLIKRGLQDPNVQVRGIAAFSLGLKRGEENLGLLQQILEADADPNMRAMAAGALGYLEDKRALDCLRHAFYEDTQWLVQFSAAVALGNLKQPEALSVLLEALSSAETLLQEAAIMALGEIGAMEALEPLLPFVESADWMLRKRLAEALGNLPDPRSEAALRQLCLDENPQVVEAAERSLNPQQPSPDVESK